MNSLITQLQIRFLSLLTYCLLPLTATSDWEDCSADRAEALQQAGQPYFVNVTADWCWTRCIGTCSLTTAQFSKLRKTSALLSVFAANCILLDLF